MLTSSRHSNFNNCLDVFIQKKFHMDFILSKKIVCIAKRRANYLNLWISVNHPPHNKLHALVFHIAWTTLAKLCICTTTKCRLKLFQLHILTIIFIYTIVGIFIAFFASRLVNRQIFNPRISKRRPYLAEHHWFGLNVKIDRTNQS